MLINTNLCRSFHIAVHKHVFDGVRLWDDRFLHIFLRLSSFRPPFSCKQRQSTYQSIRACSDFSKGRHISHLCFLQHHRPNRRQRSLAHLRRILYHLKEGRRYYELSFWLMFQQRFHQRWILPSSMIQSSSCLSRTILEYWSSSTSSYTLVSSSTWEGKTEDKLQEKPSSKILHVRGN